MLPVHQMVEKCLEIIGSPIAVINIVGVLPNVAPKNWHCSVHEGIFTVWCFADDQLAVFQGEPGPAGAELSHARLREVFLHLGEAAEIAVDFRLELARNLVTAAI